MCVPTAALNAIESVIWDFLRCPLAGLEFKRPQPGVLTLSHAKGDKESRCGPHYAPVFILSPWPKHGSHGQAVTILPRT